MTRRPLPLLLSPSFFYGTTGLNLPDLVLQRIVPGDEILHLLLLVGLDEQESLHIPLQTADLVLQAPALSKNLSLATHSRY